jgi:signal transduction histidine kinase
LSATHTTSEDQAHGLEGGADAYLTHPLEPLVLLATINALLRTKQAEQKLKETVEKLQIERHLREQFVATLTHDLRNPLSAAKTSAQMIGRSTIDSSRHPALLGRIIDCINRIDQMISNLLDANRIKAGENLPLEIEPSNLYTLVQETLDELSSIHGDRFVLHSSSTVNGYWSRNGIRRMVDNLATNAIKYGLPTTPVSIRITDRSNSVEIAVHNEGPALNREDQVRMFEPFHRSSSALTSRNKGWGLGLTLVRGIAEGHRGRVHVESEEKIGTTFRVTLPKDCRSLTSQENDKSLIHFHRKG